MRDLKVLLLIFIIASLKCHCLCHAEHSVESASSRRNKQAAVASWVVIDSGEDNDARFTRAPRRRSAPAVKNPNPCDRKLSKKPNFNVRGRRISEAKCEEFQWNLKRREEELQKNIQCEEYKNKNKMERFYSPAVVGGRQTEPGEFPHMGALGWRAVVGGWKFQCGCSLISTKYLLTAAHCSKASPRDTTIVNITPEIVRLGVTNLQWPDASHSHVGEISKMIVHPKYASPKKYYDIALVELKHELTFVNDYIQPACLWPRFNISSLGKRAFVTGWGYLDPAGRKKATELQAAEVNLINSAQCDALLKPLRNRHFHGLESHQLCAGILKGGVDTCQGDSGGPLQVKIASTEKLSYIIGVTSFGNGCARANSPGIYTRVSSFIDWIEDVVWRG